MQTPGTLNLDCYAGATWEYVLTWEVDAAVVDLTGYDARMMVRTSYTEPTTVASLTVGSGIALGGTAGTITLSRTAAQTAAFGVAVNHETTHLVYDLELIDAGGVVTRLVQGVFTVYPEVTR